MLLPLPTMLSSKPHLVSCNLPSLIRLRKPPNPRSPNCRVPVVLSSTDLNLTPPIHSCARRGLLQIRRSSVDQKDSQTPPSETLENPPPKTLETTGDGRPKDDWTTSLLLFGFWAAIMFYVFQLAPNQTPYRDTYFLQKLLNQKADDGFRMNEVLVALWYIMGLWPLVYSMLMIPTGRSSRSIVPVWPFLALSCFGGAYALIPYFVLWRPPPPPVREDEINNWPLKFLESKITAGVSLAAALGLVVYAGLADGDVWKEFYQYFRESKFIHVTCIDFSLLSAFAPFWAYNDMTARRSGEKSSWLLAVALIPLLGPALYLLLRPPLSGLPMSPSPAATETETETD